MTTATSRIALSVLPEPVALASSYEVARRLDLERRQAQRVAESGLLGPLYRTDGSVLVQADRLDELAQRRFVDGPHPAALVVRVAPARPDEDDPERDYLGWHTALTEQQRHDATRGWWSVRQPDDVELLLVVICTFVVEVLQVTGCDTGIGARRRFHTRNAPDGGRPFRNARLRTPPGGSTFLLEERR